MNFKLFKSKPRARVQVIQSTSMRLTDWTSSPELVRSADKLFATNEFQTILAILRTESPSNYGIPMGSTHDDHVAHAYKATGYNLCLTTLEAFAQRHQARTPLEATFEPEPERPLPDDAPQFSSAFGRVEPSMVSDNPAPVDRL